MPFSIIALGIVFDFLSMKCVSLLRILNIKRQEGERSFYNLFLCPTQSSHQGPYHGLKR